MLRALALALLLALPVAAQAADCLPYNPKVVTLEGRLEKRVGSAPIPGAPGVNESVAWYALVLDTPVCTLGAPGAQLMRPEHGLRTLQVTTGGPDVIDRALLGERVRVTGLLHHRRASRQYTPVLIHAQAMTLGGI